MGVSVVPWVDEGSTLTIWVMTPFFLLEAFLFRGGSILARSFGGRIVRGNLFSFMAGRSLAFCWCHKGLFDWNRLVRMFWGRRQGEGKGNEKKLWANDGKGINLSNDSKDDVKGCNRSVVKRSIVLMKQKLCFRITAKLGNSKRQYCSWQERKLGRANCSKNPAKKEREKRKRLFIHIWTVWAIHILKGLNVDAHFG